VVATYIACFIYMYGLLFSNSRFLTGLKVVSFSVIVSPGKLFHVNDTAKMTTC